jgi:hypothetical protein
MNQSQLQPLGSLAKRYGVKAVLYGKPGTGKTPMIATAPRPVILMTEPGALSVRNVMNVPAWEAYTPERIEEFFEWWFKSAEAKNFDTLGMDSGSQIAETILKQELKKQKDGRKAYGEMSRRCMEWFDQLFFMPNKHIMMICKQMMVETGKSISKQDGAFVVELIYQAQPYFPGKELNILVPHRYDAILNVDYVNVPGVGKTAAIRTKETNEYLARDRSGNLAEIEPPNITQLIAKAMQN